MPNYLLGKTYKIVNDIDDMVYVGSTTRPLCERWKEHKSRYNKGFKWKLYELFRKHGFEHFQIVLIRNTPCNSKEELKKEERKDLEFYDKHLWLNQTTPSKTYKEWVNENKEKIKIKKKEYDKLHENKRALKSKEYHALNKERIK